MKRRFAAAVVAVAGLSSAAPAAAQVDMTCQLPLLRFDAATMNIAFPDDSAQYWVAAYQAVPGTRLRIDGAFPHARYMSFNVYDPAQRPIDGIADHAIVPDPGSTNPFRLGADRTAAQRDYSAFISFDPKPAQRAPNTIYAGTGQSGLPNVNGSLIYRIYIPDAGRDEFGDVGLPTITLQAADGGKAPPSACRTLSKPTPPGVNSGFANAEGAPSGSSTGTSIFDRNPPVWRKFTNVFQAVADNLTDSQHGQPLFQAQRGLNLNEHGGSGGFLSNLDNAYVQAGINKAFGAVVVTRFRAPTFADTRAGTPTMPGGQLRYWSFCENDPPTQRFIECRNDDRTVLGPDGFATFVISSPANRPQKATAACGVNWLPFGPGARGVMIYRHMLPAADFTQSIQAATFEQEVATMGDYFPVSRYYATGAAYDAAATC